MKREVSVSIFAVLIVAAAFLTVYYLGIGSTGYAIVSQYTNESSCVAAGYTWENLTETQCNNQTVVVNQTYDCTPCLNPANETNSTLCTSWTQCVNQTETLEEVCADVVTGGQCVSVDVVPVTVDLTEPTGEKESLTGIPLTFTVTGDNLDCSYEVKHAVTSALVKNDTISNCASTTFDLTDEADYVLTLYVEGDGGNASDSISFSVSVPNEEETSSETGETTEPTTPEVVVPQAPSITQITVGALTGQDVVQGASRALSLPVQNTGTNPVSSCSLTGDDSGWVVVSDGAKNIGPSESVSYAFSVNVPDDAAVGVYTLGLSVGCTETSMGSSVPINILQKKLDFNITSVQRTRDDRVSVDYILTELAGEDQEIEIFFSIKDATGVEVGNASQNRSVDANETDDFRTNVRINETLLPVNETTGDPLEVDLTLSASFNSQIYSSSVLEPIHLGAPTGAAIFSGVGGGSVILLVVVILVVGAIFFIARKLRKSRKSLV